MSSADNREHSSALASNVDHGSPNRLFDVESMDMDMTGTSRPSDSLPSNVDDASLEQLFEELKFHDEINKASAVRTSSPIPCPPNESSIEETLIERLKEVIHEFMTRPTQHRSYNTTIRWTVDLGDHVDYSVVILIKQPSDLI